MPNICVDNKCLKTDRQIAAGCCTLLSYNNTNCYMKIKQHMTFSFTEYNSYLKIKSWHDEQRERIR